MYLFEKHNISFPLQWPNFSHFYEQKQYSSYSFQLLNKINIKAGILSDVKWSRHLNASEHHIKPLWNLFGKYRKIFKYSI